MADRMDVLTSREYEDKKSGEKKTSWTKIGMAFKARDGEGWNIQLDALPVSGKMILREPKPYEGRGGGGGESQPRRPPPPKDDDGTMPF